MKTRDGGTEQSSRKPWLGALSAIFILLFLAILCTVSLISDARAWWGKELSRTQVIPPGYKTWSLFLICDQSWLEREDKEVDQLFHDFISFGKSIGSENLAVWFWGWYSFPEENAATRAVQEKLKELSFYNGPINGMKGTETTEAIRQYQSGVGLIADGELSVSLLVLLGIQLKIPLSQTVDINSNIQYCKKFGLKPSESPYVVVTTTYPAALSEAGNYWVMRLGGLHGAEIGSALDELEDQIVLGTLDQEAIDSASYWRTWERIFNDFFKKIKGVVAYIDKVTFEIDTQFFRLEVQAAQ